MVRYSEQIINAFRENWSKCCMCNYPNGTPVPYSTLAMRIERIHHVFSAVGVKIGDKVAICGQNCVNWATVYLAITTYGAIAVPIMAEYTDDKIITILKHSDSKILFGDPYLGRFVQLKDVSNLLAFYNLQTLDVYDSRIEGLTSVDNYVNNLTNVDSWCDSVYRYDDEETMIISYTSGTMDNPKGVMIPSRAINSNMMFTKDVVGRMRIDGHMKGGGTALSLLPLAHTFGLSFDFLGAMISGNNATIYFPTDPPTPKNITKALKAVKPCILLIVPVIIERIVQDKIFKHTKKWYFKPLYKLFGTKVDKFFGNRLKAALGGNIYELIIGGSSFNKEVAQFLKDADVPFSVGYGMTECAPIISYSDYKDYKLGTCGKVAPVLEAKLSENKEIMVKGSHVMTGYYKNEEETNKVLDKDGWLKTGDVGDIDDDGNITVICRIKNVIIGPNGENVYPEEIETILNRDNFIEESVVYMDERDKKIYAVIYPSTDIRWIDGRYEVMAERMKTLNKKLGNLGQIYDFKFVDEPFEKTPKQTVARCRYIS